ncbi:DoxX family protein [Olivibacter sp. CPCC 100613]|uniref:DoxX family protein n=1 Tax=Olivibacter sp. CPCC 100613 TaxID=3079931 RepID=UPI002FF44478
MLYDRPNLFFKKYGQWAPLFIRLIAGYHLIQGVIDNMLSQANMQEFISYLNTNHFPYPLAAYISVYAQFISGCLFILGYYQRIAAVFMIINFISALLIAHMGDTYSNTFPALFMLCASLSLFFSGSGKLSIDYYRYRRGKRRKSPIF